MKYILITGTKDSGKSTTIQELCRQLKPNEVWKLEISNKDFKESNLEKSNVELIFNNVFVLRINDINILVVAGCPTEICTRIKDLLEICKILGLNISFAIIAKRYFERKKGFNTLEELSNSGIFIHEEMISKINNSDFLENNIWMDRIKRLKSIVQKNI